MAHHFQDQVMKDCGSHLGCFLPLGKASWHVMSIPMERPTGRTGSLRSAPGSGLEEGVPALVSPQMTTSGERTGARASQLSHCTVPIPQNP